MKIVCIGGKARHGKDTFAGYLKDALESKGNKVLIFHYGDAVKHICRSYFGWNGEKDVVGRTILQRVGTDIIRERDPNFWVDFGIRMFKACHDEWDYVLIPDCRFPNEIERLKEEGFDVAYFRVYRGENFDNGLSEEQKAHPSETALDEYEPDISIYNTSGLQQLEQEAWYFGG